MYIELVGWPFRWLGFRACCFIVFEPWINLCLFFFHRGNAVSTRLCWFCCMCVCGTGTASPRVLVCGYFFVSKNYAQVLLTWNGCVFWSWTYSKIFFSGWQSVSFWLDRVKYVMSWIIVATECWFHMVTGVCYCASNLFCWCLSSTCID